MIKERLRMIRLSVVCSEIPKRFGRGKKRSVETTSEPGVCMTAWQGHQRKGDGLSWKSRDQEDIIKIQK